MVIISYMIVPFQVQHGGDKLHACFRFSVVIISYMIVPFQFQHGELLPVVTPYLCGGQERRSRLLRPQTVQVSGE